ncbi:hypothetical protein JNUCC0626_32290 [Lentzea sp. JNUCC 0626]|uniref:hypothetical protein n=1 Tax=Lentzea sp. JNUCC 0626 TaxID=3367513 RepID=UPI0037481F37
MTTRPPLDPRLAMLAGRLARLDALTIEAAQVTAGLVSIAAELHLIPRGLSEDSPLLPVSTAYWATDQSVHALISAGARLLDDIQQERLRQASRRSHASDRAPVELEQPAVGEAGT